MRTRRWHRAPVGKEEEEAMNFTAIKPPNCCSHSDLSNPVATTYRRGFCQAQVRY